MAFGRFERGLGDRFLGSPSGGCCSWRLMALAAPRTALTSVASASRSARAVGTLKLIAASAVPFSRIGAPMQVTPTSVSSTSTA